MMTAAMLTSCEQKESAQPEVFRDVVSEMEKPIKKEKPINEEISTINNEEILFIAVCCLSGLRI